MWHVLCYYPQFDIEVEKKWLQNIPKYFNEKLIHRTTSLINDMTASLQYYEERPWNMISNAQANKFIIKQPTKVEWPIDDLIGIL